MSVLWILPGRKNSANPCRHIHFASYFNKNHIGRRSSLISPSYTRPTFPRSFPLTPTTRPRMEEKRTFRLRSAAKKRFFFLFTFRSTRVAVVRHYSPRCYYWLTINNNNNARTVREPVANTCVIGRRDWGRKQRRRANDGEKNINSPPPVRRAASSRWPAPPAPSDSGQRRAAPTQCRRPAATRTRTTAWRAVCCRTSATCPTTGSPRSRCSGPCATPTR